ncbi:BMC domain-containing protein [Parendozoicomonas haliclonae]
MIETWGVVANLEATDAMSKSSDVELIGYENIGSGYVTTMVQGDVGAVKAAVDAGIAAAKRVDGYVTSAVIPRPHDYVKKIMVQHKPV